MDLRTRYTALVTFTTQHVKYISDALRRLEEEEVGLWLVLLSLLSKTADGFRGLTDISERFVCVQKEVEEEKQARVDQVSDLLDWVKGLRQRSRGPSAESSLAAQQVQLKWLKKKDLSWFVI